MSCSKKDYIAVAAMIAQRIDAARANNQGVARAAVEGIAWDMAHYFGSQSQRFDQKRFLEACSVVRYTVEAK